MNRSALTRNRLSSSHTRYLMSPTIRSVTYASTTDCFKNKPDKFLSNQDLIYDYKAELTGIGIRSFINNFD